MEVNREQARAEWRAEREREENERQRGATVLQAAYRALKARVELRTLMKTIYKQRLDPVKGSYYYEDRRTGKRMYDTKPRLIKYMGQVRQFTYVLMGMGTRSVCTRECESA